MSYNTVVLLLVFASCACATKIPKDHPIRKNGNSYVMLDEDKMIVYNTSYRSKDEIRAVLSNSSFGAHMIYADYLNSGSLFAGEITFRIEIEASGSISKISIISSSTNNPKFDDELKNYFKTWRFKSIEKGNVSVIAPFKLITFPLK